ncbi:MAG: hypothetical protein O7B35_07375 [Deltaproteobacteria bacterium]|nr:hypothetical protein [Deltaproteobacteria bacterium]
MLREDTIEHRLSLLFGFGSRQPQLAYKPVLESLPQSLYSSLDLRGARRERQLLPLVAQFLSTLQDLS